MDHHAAEAGHEKTEVKFATPLRRRNPNFAAERDYRDDAEISWVKDMLVIPLD